jgi:hypothetical protein
MGGDGLLWIHDGPADELVRFDLGARKVVSKLPAYGTYALEGPTHGGVVMRQGHRLAPFGPEGWSPEHGHRIVAVDVSPDGARLATRDDFGFIIEWNARTGAPITAINVADETDSGLALLQAPYLLALDVPNLGGGTARLVDSRRRRVDVVATDLFSHHAHVASDGSSFFLDHRVLGGGVAVAGRHAYRLDPEAGRATHLGALDSSTFYRTCAAVGDRLLAHGYDSGTGKTSLFWVGPKGREVLFTTEGQLQFECAPDGRHFVRLGRNDGEPTQMLDASGRTVAELGAIAERYPRSHWTADGHHVALMTKRGQVDVWSETNGTFQHRGQVALAPDPHEPDDRGTILLSPEASHVYHARTHEVLVYAVASGVP